MDRSGFLRRLIPAFTVALTLAAPAGAGAADGACAGFKWPVDREIAWMTGPVTDHAAIGREGGAVELHLADVAEAGFELPPERAPKSGTRGGLLRLEALPAGTYQVTLSDEAWIDMVQAGARVASIDFSGVKGCPGLRKSVRFRLAAGAATVQVSGASADRIRVAVAPAQ
jgi:hypothetical protein